MKLALPPGSTSVIAHIFIQDAAVNGGGGKTGLVYSDMTAYYVRAGGVLTALTMQTIATLGTWASGGGNNYLGLKLVHDTNAPGLYELHLPNNILAAGASQVVIQLRATGAAPCNVEIQLASVPIDPDWTDDEKKQVRSALGIDGTKTTAAGGQLQTLSGIFSGITSLAKWLRAFFRKSTPDTTALAEINATGGTYDPTTDSGEALRDAVASIGGMVGTLPGRGNPPGQVYLPSGTVDTVGVVQQGGSCTLMRRVSDYSGTLITQAAITAAAYTIYEVDDDGTLSAVTAAIAPSLGHQAVAVVVASTIYDTLQTGLPWSVDAVGYNFKHTIDVSRGTAFATTGKTYLVVFTLTTTGQPILVRFRVKAL